MATALQCCLSSSLAHNFTKLKILGSPTSTTHSLSIGFSRNLSNDVFFGGNLSMSMSNFQRRLGHSIVCEVAKPDSAVKRTRQAEKKRLRNKARKSAVRTAMTKVLKELEVMRKKPDAQSEDILSVEKMIAEAYSAIDKAVQKGTLHRNTGANRKSRLARRKKAVEIHHGWYTPVTSATEAAV